MTPKGYLVSLSKDLRRLERLGSYKAFREYVRSPDFREHIVNLPVENLEAVLARVAEVKMTCEDCSPVPKKPRPIGTAKLDWQGNPALLQRLAAAYAKHGSLNHKAVAGELRITAGQARLAKKRLLDTAPLSRAA